MEGIGMNGNGLVYVSWYTKEGYLRWDMVHRGSEYDALIRFKTSRGCKNFATGADTLRNRSKSIKTPTTDDMFRILREETNKGNIDQYLKENSSIRMLECKGHPIKALYIQNFRIIPSELDCMYIHSLINGLDIARFDGNVVMEINRIVNRMLLDGCASTRLIE